MTKRPSHYAIKFLASNGTPCTEWAHSKKEAKESALWLIAEGYTTQTEIVPVYR